MKNKKNIVYFIVLLFAAFIFKSENIKASEIVISEYPVASDITYGQPLYMSVLSGGVSNVDGHFAFKEKNNVYDAGTKNVIVEFIPDDEEFSKVELEVDVTVLPRRVYLKFEKNFYKQFDGSDVIDVPSYVVGGIIDKGVYVSGNLKAKLKSSLVGENIEVILSEVELKGIKKDNYYLDLSGYKASVYPKSLEEFGSASKIEFSESVIVPISSQFKSKKINTDEISKKGFKVKDAYSVSVVNNNSEFNVIGEVSVTLKVDESSLNYKRIKIFNYYNGEYKEVKYTYKDGYLFYKCDCLGDLVIMQEKLNLWWVYVIVSLILCVIIYLVIRKIIIKRKSINRYKGFKRRKDNGSY